MKLSLIILVVLASVVTSNCKPVNPDPQSTDNPRGSVDLKFDYQKRPSGQSTYGASVDFKK